MPSSDLRTMQTAQDFVTGANEAIEVATSATYQSTSSSSCDSSPSSSSYSSDSGGSFCGEM